MFKSVTVASACLALMLTACTKEQTPETTSPDVSNQHKQTQTLRIAAAANLSEVSINTNLLSSSVLIIYLSNITFQ